MRPSLHIMTLETSNVITKPITNGLAINEVKHLLVDGLISILPLAIY